MQTARHQGQLEEEKANLEREMASVGRRNPAVPDDWEPAGTESGSEPDPLDQANVTLNHEENAAVLADLEARYDSVLGALARMQTGTYGTCTTCGQEIEEARLDADPAAATCIAHKT